MAWKASVMTSFAVRTIRWKERPFGIDLCDSGSGWVDLYLGIDTMASNRPPRNDNNNPRPWMSIGHFIWMGPNRLIPIRANGGRHESWETPATPMT